MIFGVAVFAPKVLRVPAVLLLLLFVGPKVAAMFPIWLMGLAAYHICKRVIIPVPLATTLCLGATAGWIFYEIYAWHFGRPIGPNWIGRPPLIEDYIIATLFAVHLIGFRFVSPYLAPVLRPLAGPIRWIAGATLTLYLFHLPLSQFLAAETPWPHSAWQTRLLIFGGVPVLVFIIAGFTERQKDVWRRGFEAIFQRFTMETA